MRLSVFRYFAAAFVAFSGSDRSSMYQSCLRPFSSAVACTNCQTPLALAFDSALVLNRAFDQRHVGEIERQAFSPEDVLDHRQVLAAAVEAVLDERGAGPGTARCRRAPSRSAGSECRARSAARSVCTAAATARVGTASVSVSTSRAVDRARRARALFGEAVAGGERGHFERADAIDEAIELRAQPRLGAGAAGRAQQNVDGAVERRPGLLEVPEIEIALALLVEPLGLVYEGLNGVGRRGTRRLDRLDLSRRRRRRRGRGSYGPAPDGRNRRTRPQRIPDQTAASLGSQESSPCGAPKGSAAPMRGCRTICLCTSTRRGFNRSWRRGS